MSDSKRRKWIVAAILIVIGGLLVAAVARSPFITHTTRNIDKYVDKDEFEGYSALIDSDNCTVDYVFLQQINDVDDIVFSKDKLPDGYGKEISSEDALDIYAFSPEGDMMGVYETVY